MDHRLSIGDTNMSDNEESNQNSSESSDSDEETAPQPIPVPPPPAPPFTNPGQETVRTEVPVNIPIPED